MSSAASTTSRTPAPSAAAAATAAVPHRTWIYALWYIESCLAFAAVWALLGDRTPRTFLEAAAFLLLCGAALTLPAHVLRAGMLRRDVRGARRIKTLEVLLVLAAGGVAAALSTAHGWAAIVCILLVGNALWALELEGRAARRGPGVTS